MTPETRYRLALINMAHGAQRQADACRAFVPVIIATQPADDREEQAQAYERVAQLLCNEADDLKKQEPVGYWSQPVESGRITKVVAMSRGDGWEIYFGDCLVHGVENSVCAVEPRVGEMLDSVGTLGQPVRGVRIGGRVYRQRTVSEQREHDRRLSAVRP